jgi:hypothetical protein
MKRRQTIPYAFDEDQYEVQRSNDDDGDHDVLQLNVKFASLKEQSLFYGYIPDDDSIDYLVVEVEKESPKEMADVIEGFLRALSKQECLEMVYRVCDSW